MLLSGCGPGARRHAHPDVLRPYSTPSPQLTASTPTVTGTLAPLPTPTPFSYTVVSGDNLISIAARFGVSVDDILITNPGLVAAALVPGQEIKIPSAPASADLPTPTPAPVILGQPDCHPTLDGGLWCFVAVTSPFAETLENLSAQVTLTGADGSPLASQVALSPLNILPPGESIALAAFFPAPLPEGPLTAQAGLVTSIRLLASDARYLPVTARNVALTVGWEGTSAEVRGEVTPVTGVDEVEIPRGEVWVAAVAYDAAGRVVGVRRWESTSAMPAGGELPFEMQVASSGGPIVRVEVVAEARRPVVTPTP
jgi:LysM repeat protein